MLDIININLYDYITHTHTHLSKCVTKQNGLQFYPVVLVAGPRSGARTCFHVFLRTYLTPFSSPLHPRVKPAKQSYVFLKQEVLILPILICRGPNVSFEYI